MFVVTQGYLSPLVVTQGYDPAGPPVAVVTDALLVLDVDWQDVYADVDFQEPRWDADFFGEV